MRRAVLILSLLALTALAVREMDEYQYESHEALPEETNTDDSVTEDVQESSLASAEDIASCLDSRGSVVMGCVMERRKQRNNKNTVSGFVVEAPPKAPVATPAPVAKPAPAAVAAVKRRRASYRAMYYQLMDKLEAEALRHRKLVAALKQMIGRAHPDYLRRKRIADVRRKLRTSHRALRKLFSRSRKLRKLLHWARKHENELTMLTRLKLPSLRTLMGKVDKKSQWHPWMSRRLRRDYDLGSDPKSKDPSQLDWRDWKDQDEELERVTMHAQKVADDASKKMKEIAEEKRQALARAQAQKRAAEAAAQQRALRRKARQLARQRDRKRTKRDLEELAATAEGKSIEKKELKAENVKKTKLQTPHEKGAISANAAAAKVVIPTSERIKNVEVTKVLAVSPRERNMDEEKAQFRQYSDVRRMVDSSKRTMWRYRTHASRKFIVDLKLATPQTVTEVDIFVPGFDDVATGYAGVKIYTRKNSAEQWKEAGKWCGMYGKYDKSAVDICGQVKPATAQGFKWDSWNKHTFAKAREGVRLIRLVFGEAKQAEGNSVSFSELRVLGYPAEAAAVGTAVAHKNQLTDKKILKQKECPLGDDCNPAKSCAEIKKDREGAVSAPYFINYLGKAFEVYCEMDIDGGGWTAVINPDFVSNIGLPIKVTAERVEGNVNTCGMGFYRDKLYGFHRLKGYACGNYKVAWNIEWQNALNATQAMVAGSVQGHDSRSISVNGADVPIATVAGSDGNVCGYFNEKGKATAAGVNNCWELDAADVPPKMIKMDNVDGNLVTLKIVSGAACHPTCSYGTGFNLQQFYVR